MDNHHHSRNKKIEINLFSFPCLKNKKQKKNPNSPKEFSAEVILFELADHGPLSTSTVFVN